MKKRLTALTAVILSLAILAGCSADSFSWFTSRFTAKGSSVSETETSAEADKPETVAVVTELAAKVESFGLAYQPDFGIHPYNCQSLNNRVLFSFLYEPMFVVTSSFEVVPVLASGYEVSEGGLVTTVTLRSGITFHDGSPLTAQDAAYSLENAMGSAYYGSRFYAVESMETPDDHTLVITTSVTYECLPLLLDIPIIKYGTSSYESPTGTGPYMMYGTDRMVRYPGWWQDTAPLADYTEISLIQADFNTDIRDQFEYENVNMVLSDPNSSAFAGFHNDYEIWDSSTTILQYIGYNVGNKVFSNYGLRSAITYAIDREYIGAEIMGGFGVPTVLPCSPNAEYYSVKLANAGAYNLDAFKEQLQSASVEDTDSDGILDLYVPSLGYSVSAAGTMIVCSSSYQRVMAAQYIVDQLNSLGFNITLKSLDYEDYIQALINRNYELYYGEVRLSNNFDLTQFFSPEGSLAYGSMYNSTMLSLCSLALTNSGNNYNLQKMVLDRGYITPVVMKNYALYTTRGAVSYPNTYIDWYLPALPSPEE